MRRLEEAEQILGGNHSDLFERLDLHRDARHDVSYAAGVASELGTDELRKAAEELLDVARVYVTR